MNENGVMKAGVPVVCPKCDHTMVIELSLGADLLTDEAAEEIIDKMKLNDLTQTSTTE